MFKYLSITLLSLSVALTGCVPVFVVAGATAGGAVIYDKRSFKQINTDQKISSAAQQRLNSVTDLKSKAHIVVATYNSILLLVGQAPTYAMRNKAYEQVTLIPGVRRVYNEIVVEAPSSSMQRASDSWITTKVKSKMLTKSGLHSTNIKVITEDGVVYLMGEVSHKQAAMAADVARRVSGVQKVVKVFEYPS